MTKFAKSATRKSKIIVGNSIEPQQKIDRRKLNPHLFKPGNTLGGRTKGSRNKLSEVFLKDLLADWEAAGATAIQNCRLEDPSTYLRVVASLVPKELNIREGESGLETFLEQFDGQQLDELIAGIIAIGTAQKGTGAEIKAIARSKSDGIH